jgi:hypothetical protein
MKPYLLGQGIFHVVDGLCCVLLLMFLTILLVLLWQSTHIFFVGSNIINLLILSVLLSCLSMDVLHLVVNCHISHCVWRTLEKALVSPSNSHIMQLHGSFQVLRQGDASVAMYMQQEKSLFDELTVADRPLSLENFNLYMFHGFHDEFKDLVTNLVTKAEPLSYTDLYNHLFTYEFLHNTSLQSMNVNSHLLPQPPLPPTTSVHLSTTPISIVIEVVLVATDILIATVTATKIGLTFVAYIPPVQIGLLYFRCFCFLFSRPYHAHKLDFRSSPCVILGYSSSHLGYHCLDLMSTYLYLMSYLF